MTKSKSYNIGLDLIRIFAMLAVVWVHLKLYLPIPDRFLPYFNWGAYGVQIFFVLSGYLACCILTRGYTAGTYYKNRAIRILPAYYIAIISGMIFHTCFLRDVTPDTLKLNWARYFLGIHTILPSTNFMIWNNMYGLWTMCCFIWFYILAPFLVKWASTLKRAIFLFVVAILIRRVWLPIMQYTFAETAEIDHLSSFLQYSPVNVLYQFLFGVIVYYLLKEEKPYQSIAFLTITAIIGLIANRPALVWCALCGCLIIVIENTPISLPENVSRLIRFFSRASYHVYLTHMLAFDISWYVSAMILHNCTYLKYVLWGIFSIACTVLLCSLMRIGERVVYNIIHTTSNAIACKRRTPPPMLIFSFFDVSLERSHIPDLPYSSIAKQGVLQTLSSKWKWHGYLPIRLVSMPFLQVVRSNRQILTDLRHSHLSINLPKQRGPAAAPVPPAQTHAPSPS